MTNGLKPTGRKAQSEKAVTESICGIAPGHGHGGAGAAGHRYSILHTDGTVWASLLWIVVDFSVTAFLPL